MPAFAAVQYISEPSPAWTVKRASDSFSQLFNSSFEEPQTVTHRDGREAVMISKQAFEALRHQGQTLGDALARMTHDPRLEAALQEPEAYLDLALES